MWKFGNVTFRYLTWEKSFIFYCWIRLLFSQFTICVLQMFHYPKIVHFIKHRDACTPIQTEGGPHRKFSKAKALSKFYLDNGNSMVP
jgi:hypothetical protein